MLAGDGNCFYRAFLAAILEGLHRDASKRPVLLSAFRMWYSEIMLTGGQLPAHAPGAHPRTLNEEYLNQSQLGFAYREVHNQA